MTGATVPASTSSTRSASSSRTRRGPARRGRRGLGLRVAVAVVVCVVMLFPLYLMVITAFSPRQDVISQDLHLFPSEPTLANFSRVFGLQYFWTWFSNSLVISTIVTALTVVVNLLAGYAFAKLPFPGKSTLFLLLLGTMMVPVQAIIVSQFRIVTALNLVGTFWAVIIPSAASAFGIFLARQFIIAIPDELMEAARVDGAGRLRVFFSIVLPLCKPLIAVLVLLTFMYQWNDFLWPLIVLRDPALQTLPVALQAFRGQFTTDYGGLMAMTLVTVAPMVVLFLAFQRFFVQGLARTGIR